MEGEDFDGAALQSRMHLIMRGLSTVSADELPGDMLTSLAMLAAGVSFMKRSGADLVAVLYAAEALYPLVQYAATNE
jgi:hypothetical protein